tara:strand:+ start:187 stop:702 length:516 start_codon:yes stop_codon:yes gene_type:complete
MKMRKVNAMRILNGDYTDIGTVIITREFQTINAVKFVEFIERGSKRIIKLDNDSIQFIDIIENEVSDSEMLELIETEEILSHLEKIGFTCFNAPIDNWISERLEDGHIEDEATERVIIKWISDGNIERDGKQLYLNIISPSDIENLRMKIDETHGALSQALNTIKSLEDRY